MSSVSEQVRRKRPWEDDYKNQNSQHEAPYRHDKVARTDAQAATVAQHYNARPDVGRQRRNDSPIIRLKNFNNWVKSILINKHASRGIAVLDFCCGKGGDLLKWSKAQIDELVGVDIAAISVQQARERYLSGRNNRFRAEFFVSDCFVEDIDDLLGGRYIFDLVSCQFALHYSFETETKARTALRNIASNLRTGGYFIGTIPNSYWLKKQLAEAPGLEFGNSILKVRFEEKDHQGIFGHKYWFELKDAIDDCPEYLVHFPTLIELAKEYGLEPVYKKNFHDIYAEESKVDEYHKLLYRMNVIDDNGTMSDDEWETIGLYMAFAFRKRVASDDDEDGDEDD
ncbi:guanine-7 methyltransferase, isoform CRA_c [Gaertneriomyces semiglobifer]|nr:guanine-7 methyltransferase, isoform CRA_c [Gaertneriomyces semiglobifer]